MTARTLPIAIPFDGTRLNYCVKFRKQVIQVASIASSHLGQILFDILSDHDRLLRWPPAAGANANEPDFEPLEVPDPLDLAANLTPQVIAHHTMATQDFQRLQTERCNFYAWLIDALPQTVRDRIDNFTSLNTRQLLAALDAKYGRLHAKDLHQLRAALREPYDTATNIEDHVSSLNHIFNVLASQNMVMPDHAKFEVLFSSIYDCPLYHSFIGLYESLHSDIADQTYDSLCDALLAYRCRSSRTATIAAAQQDTLDRLTQQVAQLQQQLAAALKPTAHPVAPSARSNPPTKYCFTHGLGYHTGHTCKNRAPNHIPHATMDNKMGGSERVATTSAPTPRSGANKSSH